MRKNLKTLLIVCFIGLSTTAMLKANDTLKISLKQAIEIGLSKSPTIKIADKQLERVDYSNKEKMAALYPNISASGSYQRALKKQRMFFSFPGMPSNPDGIEVGQDNTFVGGLSASLPIISPTLWATLKMNEVDLQLANETARSSEINLINQITKAYYTILMMQDSYSVFERNYKNTETSTRIIADKYKLGSVSEFEWLRADVQLRNALTNTISAESGVEMSKLQLKTLMGLDLSTEIKLEGNLSEYEKVLYGEMLAVDTTHLTKNTDLKQFDLRLEQMKKSLDVQKSTWLPTLAASVNYQYMSMGNDSTAFSKYPWFPTSTASLSLSIPIFQGGAKHYKSKQLKLQMDEMNLQKVNLKKNLELQANIYVDNMKKSIDKIQSNKKGLVQAEKAVTISRKMYEEGVATFLDLSNSELNLLQAGLSYNQSVYDFISAKADLEKLLGKTLN
jgi:outer membrane protein